MATRKQQRATAREHLRLEQERRRLAVRRYRVIGVAVAVVVIVALVVTIGVVVQRQRAAEAVGAKGPRGTVAGGLALPVGPAGAPATLTVYEDFRCPVCKQFEDGYGPTVDRLVAAGDLQVQYHLAKIIDAGSGGSGSARSANAAACAQDAGKFRAYHDVLYANQPEESDDAFTDDRLLQLAGKVNGLGGDAAFRSCVTGDRYGPWVARVQGAFDRFSGGAPATPTVLLNGKELPVTSPGYSPEKLAQQVQALAGGGSASGSASGSPSGSPSPATS